jgi:putative aldouronate transport system permease protein
MIQEKSFWNRLFDVFNYAFILCVALLALLPMVHVLSVSISSPSAATGGFVTFWPIGFSLNAYDAIFKTQSVYRAFMISVERTVLGTALSMFLTVLTAYPLSKTPYEFKGRNILIWVFIFTMLFNGGMIPHFMVIRNLGLLNTIWALILPGAISVWNIILMINFFKEIPKELEEAAILDGASHWQVLWRVYLPLSLPVLATLSLFTAVWHWNSWFDGMIYMTSNINYPLQTYLRTVVIDMSSATVNVNATDIQLLSNRSLRAAMILVTTLPILVVYPFLQRYFVTGIKLGAVKG